MAMVPMDWRAPPGAPDTCCKCLNWGRDSEVEVLAAEGGTPLTPFMAAAAAAATAAEAGCPPDTAVRRDAFVDGRDPLRRARGCEGVGAGVWSSAG